MMENVNFWPEPPHPPHSGANGGVRPDKLHYTILYSQSSPAPPALPPPPLLLLHLLLILHCSALHLTSASQQVAPDPAIGRLRPLGIYTVIQLYTSQYFSKVYFKIRYHL